MERCPNCGEMVRSGARYCTTCGYRMPDLPSEAPGVEVNADPPAPPPASNGWPDFSPSQDEPLSGPPPEEPPPADESLDIAAVAELEAAAISSFWPAPPVAQAIVSTSAEVPTNGEEVEQSETVSALSVEAEPDEPLEVEGSEARERVLAMIDELREYVVASPNDNRDDLKGVIAELEVASTAPGAFDQDELASLRDTLLSARDRPRDLDTVLDLTGRIDSLVALVFAYERSHAAIERALDVLRRQ